MQTMPLPANRPVVNATSAHALLSIFAANGLDRVFLVPGESYLGVLDALIDFPSIESVVCRHESGAGYMAVADGRIRSEEHTSELQSLMRISYAVFCLKKKKINKLVIID